MLPRVFPLLLLAACVPEAEKLAPDRTRLGADAELPPAPLADAGPTVDERSCSAGTYRHADKDFPGLTANDLASVRILLHIVSPSAVQAPGGFDWMHGTGFVRDGAITVTCGPGIDRVRFIAGARKPPVLARRSATPNVSPTERS